MGVAIWVLGGGGGPHGTGGKVPERPCDRNGSLGGGLEGFTLLSLEVMVECRDLVEVSSLVSSSLTSSMDDVESRRAVSNGDIDGSWGIGGNVRDVGVSRSSEFFSLVLLESLECRGVVTEEAEDGRSVKERIDGVDLE